MSGQMQIQPIMRLRSHMTLIIIVCCVISKFSWLTFHAYVCVVQFKDVFAQDIDIWSQTNLTSEKILEAAKYDRQIQLRLAGVNDLIADKGKYHLRC